MAKKFAGFTPEQLGKIDPTLAGKQSDEQQAIIAANPALSARLGKLSSLAQKRVEMAYGGYIKGYREGGLSQNNGPFISQDGQKYLRIPENVGEIKNNIFQPLPYQGNAELETLTSRIPVQEGESTSKPIGFLGDPNASQVVRRPGSDSIGVDLSRPLREPASPGVGSQEQLDAAQLALAQQQAALQEAMAAQAANPEDEALSTALTKAQANVDQANAQLQQAQSAYSTVSLPSAPETTKEMLDGTNVAQQDVVTTSEEQKKEGEIAEGTGQIDTPAGQVTAETAETATPIAAPEPTTAQTYTPLEASAGTEDILKRLTAATGKPSDEALADAAQMDPQELAQLGLSAAQIQQAQQVQPTEDRKVEEGEMIEGSTVDMERVRKETNFEAATGAPSTDATVQGQLTGLMEDFEGKEPPAWAAGAMRAAAAQMAARGLTGSSMAGQAIVQAAMESALPIASQDAQTVASFEQQNLSNKQQAAMFAAQQRAEFLNLEFNQDFQARVANAAKISEIANMNFTADQQVALENARLAQSVDLANLNATNAKVLADAAAMSQLDMANLNNRQQAQVQNAQSFLQMDMQNLSNAQQTSMFKAQQQTSALLSDVAAENASRQFNATSQSQNDQFFANLSTQVARFNNEQANSMNQFNTNQANSIAQFNVSQKDAREQFNAENALIIAQANAQWAQKITTTDNAAINQANRDAAMAENDFTMAAYNNILQKERDAISYAFKATQSEMERDLKLTLTEMQAEIDREQMQASIDQARGSGWGSIMAAVAPTVTEWALTGAVGGG